MKKIRLGLLAALLVGVTACFNDDGYSLSDMWVGFGVIGEGEDGAYKIIMDNKDVLVPVASNGVDWQEDFENGNRIHINYTILDKEEATDSTQNYYYVKVNDIDKILMKGILDLTEENEDSIGNNQIEVKKFWATDSLLNLKLSYWGHEKRHFINLVKQPGEVTEDSQPVKLELRHNNNGDDEMIPYVAYVSFNLNEIRVAGLDSVQYEISWTDYEGVEHSKTETYNYQDL